MGVGWGEYLEVGDSAKSLCFTLSAEHAAALVQTLTGGEERNGGTRNGLRVCVNVYRTYVCSLVYIHSHMSENISTCIHVCACIRVCLCMSTGSMTHPYMCMCIHVH